MSKLYLTSLKLDGLYNLIPDPKGKHVVFIPTAADVYEDKWFADADRIKLSEMGFDLTEISLKDEEAVRRIGQRNSIDIIYFTGGNTFYLLDMIRKSGFDKIIAKFLESGTVYAGSSAGAVVAGPNIESIRFLDDPSKAPNLKSFDGLNFVDFVILPHYGKEKYKKKYEQIMKDFEGSSYRLQTLTDNQAMVIDGDKMKTLEFK